ncbi:Glutamate receptor ionotropic, kainate 3 [Amphibalanus amphitrite]|uniref:Glutamate receptor ionotropic, kainate 3 n=1 Tax=Amphibalanus amphitrite TaxID=1232801 RepID=A0A6A4V9J8_AMPAM|nr:Glutamate receptor ionotropic, kainate 3 [Amphibalanus amphitrite]
MLQTVGEWTPAGQVNITDYEAFYDPGSLNVTLVVTTNLETPYVMMRAGKNYTGNARFYGFCIDLLELIADMAGFSYIMEVVPDRRYGAQDPETGEWDGMVNEIIKGDTPYVMLRQGANLTGNDRFEGFCIDLLRAIANFVGFNYTITLNPDGLYGVVDLETGEWNGIVRQLIDKKPTSQETRLFSFMNPLAVHIWLYVLTAYLLVSLTMFVVARVSPYEWHNPHPCTAAGDVMENQFSVSNSFWFTIGTLMQQGSDLNPKVGEG